MPLYLLQNGGRLLQMAVSRCSIGAVNRADKTVKGTNEHAVQTGRFPNRSGMTTVAFQGQGGGLPAAEWTWRRC